jgi:hypothetical protein
MDYRKIEYIIYLFYLLIILFLFFITKTILKKRYQNIKQLNLKSAGIVFLIILPLIFCLLSFIAWYMLKDQKF